MTLTSAKRLVRALLRSPIARDRERVGATASATDAHPGLRSAVLPVPLRVGPGARLGVEPSGLGDHPRLRARLSEAHRTGGDRAVVLVDVEQLHPLGAIVEARGHENPGEAGDRLVAR